MSEVYYEKNGINKCEVNIKVKEEGDRIRRSIDGVNVPSKNIIITFPLNDELVDLHLIRKDDLSVNVPVYTSDTGGNIIKVDKKIPSKNNVFFYQDQQKFAAFYVETSDLSSCLFGSFEDQSNEFFLEPRDAECGNSTSNPLVFKIFKIKHKQFQYNDSMTTEETHIRPTHIDSRTADVKRSVTEYKVEMLLIIDYSIYSYWLTQSAAGTTATRDTEAKYNIRQFYAWVINGMDIRYKNIQTSAKNAGIYIATATKSSFTENNKDSSSPKPKVDSGRVLEDVLSWVNDQSGLPSHDHAMMFSRYDFTSGGSSDVTGLAFVAEVCQSKSVSIVEDNFDFVMITVAAHELGHSLSAIHDGADSSYIMAASSSPPQNTNPWKFSSQSTSSFTTYINSLNSAGTNCMTSLSETFDPTALNEFTLLPGQAYDLDTYCKNIYGSESSLCKAPYKGNYTSICLTLWCLETGGSGTCQATVAGDGMQCGHRKWCISGICTYDVCAPPGDESCLYGERSGNVLVYNGQEKTCADVPTEPYLCYNGDVRAFCCKSCPRFYTGRQGCEYGDKLSGCSSQYCPQYKDNECCGFCYTGSTQTTVNTITNEEPDLCTRTTTVMKVSDTSKTNITTSTVVTEQSTHAGSSQPKNNVTFTSEPRKSQTPSTGQRLSTVSITTTTVSSIANTNSPLNEEMKFTFVLRMAIVISENLSDSTQYASVKRKAETALTTLYRKGLGNGLKSCNVTGLRKGSLVVNYDLYTTSDSSASSNLVSINKDLLSGKENVTYDGHFAPVSSLLFVDSSGQIVIFTNSSTGCQILKAINPCRTGSQCVEEQQGPVCRLDNINSGGCWYWCSGSTVNDHSHGLTLQRKIKQKENKRRRVMMIVWIYFTFRKCVSMFDVIIS
ncbi:uncharacterized protein LOC134246545 [Saccostrea cucullata]|uniref:uncharacterized protein LOC134246545 n=1 Tax=Saccostrea cuccullata TaxID=36930 RepID=UPI002ED0F934